MARLLTAQDDEQLVTVTEAQLRLDDPDPDASYTVCLLTDATMQAIRRKHTTKRPNRQGQVVEVTDEVAVGGDMVDHVIRDWTGVVTRTAAGLFPVPCSREMKIGLDPYVRSALVDYASRNQRVEAQAQAASFRAASDVL
jgi:hypothetical protein